MTGQELIEAVVLFLRRYVAMSAQQELTMALWCLHTWTYRQLSRTTAYVEVTGVSGSGKTTLMEACSLLSRGSVMLTTLRTLAMCRKISETDGAVTFFVDEAERLNNASYGDQRSMLASGYRKGGLHLVTVGKETATFEVWCPKMFTTLRTTTAVIHNRCIPIWMERAAGRKVSSLSLEWERAEAEAAGLIQTFVQVLKLTPRVITVEADWLTSERDREIWTPLVSLAHTLKATPAMLETLKAASVDLSSLRGIERRCDTVADDDNAKERSYAVRLLADVQAVVKDEETNVLSRVLVERLHALSVGPWRTYSRTGLTELTLAQLLGVFGVESTTVQVGKGRTGRVLGKGYKVKELRAAKV